MGSRNFMAQPYVKVVVEAECWWSQTCDPRLLIDTNGLNSVRFKTTWSIRDYEASDPAGIFQMRMLPFALTVTVKASVMHQAQ